MQTKKILAEQLKAGDTVRIPASSQSNEELLRVDENPEYYDNTILVYVKPIVNGVVQSNKRTQKEYGRKVDLEIED